MMPNFLPETIEEISSWFNPCEQAKLLRTNKEFYRIINSDQNHRNLIVKYKLPNILNYIPSHLRLKYLCIYYRGITDRKNGFWFVASITTAIGVDDITFIENTIHYHNSVENWLNYRIDLLIYLTKKERLDLIKIFMSEVPMEYLETKVQFEIMPVAAETGNLEIFLYFKGFLQTLYVDEPIITSVISESQNILDWLYENTHEEIFDILLEIGNLVGGPSNRLNSVILSVKHYIIALEHAVKFQTFNIVEAIYDDMITTHGTLNEEDIDLLTLGIGHNLAFNYQYSLEILQWVREVFDITEIIPILIGQSIARGNWELFKEIVTVENLRYYGSQGLERILSVNNVISRYQKYKKILYLALDIKPQFYYVLEEEARAKGNFLVLDMLKEYDQ